MTENCTTQNLDNLRQEIDRIDDQMLDLIVERATLVEKVGTVKREMGESIGIFLRPGREMEILRRLVRRARGSFPRSVIVRMWREMFAALVAVQGPMTVGVYTPQRGAGFLELARDAYGAYTTMIPFTTPGQVIRAVTDGDTSIGIVPMPDQEHSDPWWITLAGNPDESPKIVARIPFIGPGPGRGDGVEGFVIARLPQENTGSDKTLLAVETDVHLSRTAFRSLTENADLDLTEVLADHALFPEVRLYLAEISGCVLANDPRIDRLLQNAHVSRIAIIGGYAVPLTATDLSH